MELLFMMAKSSKWILDFFIF